MSNLKKKHGQKDRLMETELMFAKGGGHKKFLMAHKLKLVNLIWYQRCNTT